MAWARLQYLLAHAKIRVGVGLVGNIFGCPNLATVPISVREYWACGRLDWARPQHPSICVIQETGGRTNQATVSTSMCVAGAGERPN